MNAIHHLDLVRFVTGSPFVSAIAEVDIAPGVQVEDRAAAALRLEGGAVASLVAHAASAGARDEERIQIDGTLGRLDLPDPYTSDPLRVYLRRPWDGFQGDRWHEVASSPIDAFVAYLDAFTAAVEAGSAAPVGPRDAAAALATVLAIYASAETGRAVSISSAAVR